MPSRTKAKRAISENESSGARSVKRTVAHAARFKLPGRNRAIHWASVVFALVVLASYVTVWINAHAGFPKDRMYTTEEALLNPAFREGGRLVPKEQVPLSHHPLESQSLHTIISDTHKLRHQHSFASFSSPNIVARIQNCLYLGILRLSVLLRKNVFAYSSLFL